MSPAKNEVNWAESEKLVMSEIGSLKITVGDLTESVVKLRIEMGAIKIRAGIFAVVGSAIPVLLLLAIGFLKGY